MDQIRREQQLGARIQKVAELGGESRMTRRRPNVLVVHPNPTVCKQISDSEVVMGVTPGAMLAGHRFDLIMVHEIATTERNKDWLDMLRTRLSSEEARIVYL